MIELTYTDTNGVEQTTNVDGEALSNIISVNPETIKVDHTKNTRSKLGDIKSLSESILHTGQLSPVVVVVDSDGELSLIAGFRRHAAIMHLRNHAPGQANREILVQIVDAAEARERAVVNITENAQRLDLTGMEKARAVVALIEDHKMSRKEIAGIFGMSVAWVSNIKSLVSLPEVFQKAIDDGRISEQAGYEISKMDEKDQAKWLEVLNERGSLSYQEVHESRRAPSTKRRGSGASDDNDNDGDGDGDGDNEESSEPAAIRPRPGKTIAAFFEIMAQADNDKPLSEDGRKLAKTISRFAAGKTSEKALIKALREHFPSDDE